MAINYLNPEVTFTSIMMIKDTSDSGVYLCGSCANQNAFEELFLLSLNEACSIEACQNDGEYWHWVMPELIEGFYSKNIIQSGE